MKKIIKPKEFINGVISLPGDKSLAHRALILGAISSGRTKIKNFPFSKTCMYTLNCLKNLSVDIKISSGNVIINGKGIHGLSKPNKILNAGTSATTLRLLMGLLAAQNFPSKIKCTGSLKNRPMDRVINPLRKMGANIVHGENFEIFPSNLSAINYKMPIASAQVKSAIILAGLYCNDTVQIIEPIKSRDHTEHMINYFGGDIKFDANKILVGAKQNLFGKNIELACDVSNAAFFIVLATIFPNAHLILNNILVNPRRIGFINVLKKMGANIKFINQRKIYEGEWVADIEIKSARLHAIEICGQTIVDMIDEVPAFVVAALFADGTSIIKDAGELHFKESDRINCLCEEFNRIGAKIKPTGDGMIIESGFDYKFTSAFSHNDHRIAMTLVIFALAIKNKLVVYDVECISDSFVTFFDYVENFF